MKLRYYIPYWITWVISEIIKKFKDIRPGSNWDKYFGGGYNKVTFMSFMVGMRKKEPQIYWLMLIPPNVLVIFLVILTFSVIKLIW